MRILVCSAYFESHRGGIENVVDQLAREYCSLGHSVSWLATDASNPPSGASAASRAVPLRASNVSERWLQIPRPIPWRSAFRIIKREVARADVVHLHDALYLVHLLAAMLARWHRTGRSHPAHRRASLSQSRAAPHDAGNEPAAYAADASVRRCSFNPMGPHAR
jgi:hypothetical protein